MIKFDLTLNGLDTMSIETDDIETVNALSKLNATLNQTKRIELVNMLSQRILRNYNAIMNGQSEVYDNVTDDIYTVDQFNIDALQCAYTQKQLLN
jgi:hypothetical protein